MGGAQASDVVVSLRLGKWRDRCGEAVTMPPAVRVRVASEHFHVLRGFLGDCRRLVVQQFHSSQLVFVPSKPLVPSRAMFDSHGLPGTLVVMIIMINE